MAKGARKKAVERRGIARRLRLPSSGPWLIGIGLVVLLVLGTVVVLRTIGEDPASDAGDAPGATAGSDGAGGPDGPGGPDEGDGADGPWDPYATTSSGLAATDDARAEWEPVVQEFTDALLDPTPTDRWTSSLDGLVTEQLADRLRHVDPTRLPAGDFASAEVEAAGDTAADLTVTVGSERGDWSLGIRIVDLPGDDVGWLVYAYEDRTSGATA